MLWGRGGGGSFFQRFGEFPLKKHKKKKNPGFFISGKPPKNKGKTPPPPLPHSMSTPFATLVSLVVKESVNNH